MNTSNIIHRNGVPGSLVFLFYLAKQLPSRIHLMYHMEDMKERDRAVFPGPLLCNLTRQKQNPSQSGELGHSPILCLIAPPPPPPLPPPALKRQHAAHRVL